MFKVWSETLTKVLNTTYKGDQLITEDCETNGNKTIELKVFNVCVMVTDF